MFNTGPIYKPPIAELEHMRELREHIMEPGCDPRIVKLFSKQINWILDKHKLEQAKLIRNSYNIKDNPNRANSLDRMFYDMEATVADRIRIIELLSAIEHSRPENQPDYVDIEMLRDRTRAAFASLKLDEK